MASTIISKTTATNHSTTTNLSRKRPHEGKFHDVANPSCDSPDATSSPITSKKSANKTSIIYNQESVVNNTKPSEEHTKIIPNSIVISDESQYSSADDFQVIIIVLFLN